jgi:arylsulfatase A-like enzyme
MTDKPGVVQFNPTLNEEQIANLDYLYRRRVQTLQAVDELIGQVIGTLEQTGQLENTYIIFTSDNGFHLGQHRMNAGKGTLYEEDIRVPFVIRGPGVPTGASLQGFLSGNVDLAPTIAELAGVNSPAYVDGRSLVPLLGTDKPALGDWRSVYFLEIYGQEAQEDQEGESPLFTLNEIFGLRTTDYLYVERKTGLPELYDMHDDPYQLQNMITTADQALVDELSALLHDLQTCSGAACRTLDGTDLKE